MTKNLATKRVLILSDVDKLARVISLGLNRYLGIEAVHPWPQDRVTGNGYDLIIVALGSSASEPIVALSQAGLTRQIGRVPILIISDRPAVDAPEDHIAHLDFPFDVGQLCQKVAAILRAAPGGPPRLDADSC